MAFERCYRNFKYIQYIIRSLLYMEGLRNLIFQYSHFFILVPLVISFLKRGKGLNIIQFVFLYLLLSGITELISFILWKQSRNNFPILHAYTIFEFLILLGLFARLLEGFIRRSILLWVAICFTAFSLTDSFLISGIFTYNLYARSIEALILITLSLSWFIRSVSLEDAQKQEYNGVNYIVGGILVYFSGSITLFSTSGIVKEMSETFRMDLWTMHTILILLLYILITIGLWRAKTR